MKSLTLKGWVLTPIEEHAPFGLLTMWDRHPQSFTSLEHLHLMTGGSGLPLGPYSDALASRLAALTGKRLRQFELSDLNGHSDRAYKVDKYAAFAAGVCCNAPLLESLKLQDGVVLEPAELGIVLRAVAPRPGVQLKRGGQLRELREVHATDFAPLARAMRGGGLQRLEVLELYDVQEAFEVPALLPLLQCLRQDARVCPRLRVLDINTIYPLAGSLLARLWLALGGRQLEHIRIAADDQMVDNLTLRKCTQRALNWLHLKKLDMEEVVMETETTAAVLTAILRDCPNRAQVSFAASVSSESDHYRTMLSDMYYYGDISVYCSKQMYMEDPACALGLKELKLEPVAEFGFLFA